MNKQIYEKIKMNFENDIREQMIKLLKENCDKNFNKENTTLELIINYLNSANRRIYPKPRNVVESDKITNIIRINMIDGKKSEEEIKAIEVLKKFIDKFKSGEDMNGHLSKNIYNSNLFNADGGATKDCKSRDYLLDDWGIHHIHLDLKEATNVMEMNNNRAEYLLFIKVTNEKIYLIDIKEHLTDNFNDINLIETIDKNWPYLINNMPLDIKSTDKISGRDIKEIRKKHQLAIHNVNGKVCFPMGGGLNSTGTNIKHIEEGDMILEDIKIIKKSIIKDYERIRDKSGIYDDIIELKLECVEESGIISGYIITEINTGFQMLFHIEGNKLATYFEGFSID